MFGDDLLDEPAFGLSEAMKGPRLHRALDELTAFHRERSPEYRRLVDVFGPTAAGDGIASIPFLPVALFKSHRLQSVDDGDVVKTLSSSGTSGQVPSRIVLDAETARLQTRALVRILTTVLGPKRLPMLVVDAPAVVGERRVTTARGAGVLGLLNFARKPTFVLRPDLSLDEDVLDDFLAENGGGPFIVFGFTFMVWAYLLQRLAGTSRDMSNGILIHSGGWKKLEELRVDNDEFKAAFAAELGLTSVHNFYGMVEQVGSVFLEGPDGLLHAPAFADVIIRDPTTWAPAPPGQVGVVQVVSILPRSYPGHSLLTEDLGVVHPPSGSGWSGTSFSVLGRVPRSELRGCSDTHAFSRVAS